MEDLLTPVPETAPGNEHDHDDDREAADRLVLDLITRHAESLLRVARRYSYCPDDAQDAYQRGMEILMRHAHRLDPARAAGWLHTVVKHEALEVRRQRGRLVGMDELDLDRLENRTDESPEERVMGFDRVAKTAEALRRVKANEARALWLRASGDSYAEICERTGWTYTKVNRCLAEGRKSFLEHFAGLEAGDGCERWHPILSAIVDGEADAESVVDARAHLRHCAPCRATLRRLRIANTSLAALVPIGTGTTAAAGELDLDLPLADAPAGLVTRALDALTTFLHTRTAATSVRLQSALDLAANHKLAAVAASAAAMAGGGVAVEHVGSRERPVRHVAARPEPRTTATPVAYEVRPHVAPVTHAQARRPPQKRTAATTRSPARATPTARVTEPVRAPQPVAVRATAPPPPAAPEPGPSAEFGFEVP